MKLHPTSTQILQIWIIFQSTIDPLTKLVHVPTMAEKIFIFKDDTSSAQASFEFLMFTIYLSVVNALSPERVLVMLGQSEMVDVYLIGWCWFLRKVQSGDGSGPLSQNSRA